MERLNEREWVIGLHDYDGATEPQQVFAAFHDLIVGELQHLGLDLTHVGIEGDGYSGKATKANGAALKRARGAGFAGITGKDPRIRLFGSAVTFSLADFRITGLHIDIIERARI